MRESIFRKLKKKKRTELAAMPGVYDELPPPRPADDTYLKPKQKERETEVPVDIEASSSGVPTLPPPPPKPMTPDTSFDDTGAAQPRTSTSFAGVILKSQPVSIPGDSKPTGFDPIVASSPTRPRDSRHIVHENEFGDEVEYAISKKDSNKKPEVSGLSVRDRAKVFNTSAVSEESDVYLEPKAALGLAKEPSELSRYARHIDVVKAASTHQETSSVSDNDINSNAKASTPIGNQPPTPKQEYRYSGAIANRPVDSSPKVPISLKSNVSVSPLKPAQAGSFQQTPFSYITASKTTPVTTKKVNRNHNDDMITKPKDYSEQTYAQKWRNTDTVGSPQKPPLPDLSNDNFSFDNPVQMPPSPVKLTSVHWSDSTKSNKSEPRVLHAPQRQQSLPQDEYHLAAIAIKRSTPPLVQQPSHPAVNNREEEHTQRDVVQNIFETHSDNKSPGGTVASRSSRTKTVGTKPVVYKSQTSKEAGTQYSDETTLPHEELGGTVAGRSSRTKTVSIKPVVYKSQTSKEASTQYSDETTLPQDEPRSVYMYSGRDDRRTAVTNRQMLSPVISPVTRSTSYNDTSQEVISTETQTGFEAETTKEDNSHVVMKSRGTSAKPEMDQFGQYRDTSSEEDVVSRVHSAPKDNSIRPRIIVQEYRETGTQTSDAHKHGDPSKLKYIRAKTYNHAVTERHEPPETWQSRMPENPIFEDDSDISTQLSSDWYKQEDMPDLWDPDKMLKMFAGELERRGTLPSSTGHVELREEFNPKKYLQFVPKEDSSGLPFPPWKRLVMAKQMAEKAQFEEDMNNQKSEDEVRMESLPHWKRAIIQKRKT